MKRHLTCCCCGEYAGYYSQHWNRDTGFGICRGCFDKQAGRYKEGSLANACYSPDEMRSAYGIEGINFEPSWDLGALKNCDLDTANDLLRQGLASEHDAAEYVRMWNAIRATGAKLHHYTRPFGETGMRMTEIVIFERN